MQEPVSRGLRQAGLDPADFPHLIRAERLSVETLQRCRDFFDSLDVIPHPYDETRTIQPRLQGMDVVVFGSLARYEMAPTSDLDYLVVAHQLSDAQNAHDVLLAAVALDRTLDHSPPGRSGMFRVVASAADLVNRLGLEPDTNHHLVRRMLILQESQSLYAPSSHEHLVRQLLNRYLVDYSHREAVVTVPRFLLNDALRYWRSLAIDYAAKRWESSRDGWGLRYVKLRTTRKVAFASTVLAIMGPAIADEPLTVDSLYGWLALPPLARLARLADYLDAGGTDALTAVLRSSDRVARFLQDDVFRERAKEVSRLVSSDERVRPVEGVPDDFYDVLRESRWLQDALESLLFDGSSTIARLSRTYLAL